MIATSRFLLRQLTTDDANERYLGWFRTPGAERIAASNRMLEVADLRAYIAERAGRSDVLFLGIFDKKSGDHIGNIKYEPIDEQKGYAVFGVLIGEPDARGKGVTAEVLAASAAWLRDNRGIREIVLGVEADNLRAIRAYEKAGFTVGETSYIPKADKILQMVSRS